MSDEFDMHFKGMRIPVIRQSINNAPRLFWCQACSSVHNIDYYVEYGRCSCGNIKCVEILPKENIIKIMDYMRENKKFTLSKEDLVEILI